jgi:hypothetical protein
MMRSSGLLSVLSEEDGELKERLFISVFFSFVALVVRPSLGPRAGAAEVQQRSGVAELGREVHREKARLLALWRVGVVVVV